MPACVPACICVQICRYGDAVRELDYGVGLILAAIKAAGVQDNTLVMFSSDNGGATYAKEMGRQGKCMCLVLIVPIITQQDEL